MRRTPWKNAKEHAVWRIKHAFTEAHKYEPTMIRFPKGEIGLVYRTLEGWQTQILWANEKYKQFYNGRSSAGTAFEALIALKRDMAQNSWNDEATRQGRTLVHEHDTEGQREHERSMAFQEAYARAKAQGYSDSVCHAMACDQR